MKFFSLTIIIGYNRISSMEIFGIRINKRTAFRAVMTATLVLTACGKKPAEGNTIRVNSLTPPRPAPTQSVDASISVACVNARTELMRLGLINDVDGSEPGLADEGVLFESKCTANASGFSNNNGGGFPGYRASVGSDSDAFRVALQTANSVEGYLTGQGTGDAVRKIIEEALKAQADARAVAHP